MQRPYRQHLIATRMGYLTKPEDDAALLKEDPLQIVLVRCGNGRFQCPIQDLQNMIDMINKSGTTYVRDVSVSDRF